MKLKTLKQFIQAGKFDYVNKNINDTNFPDFAKMPNEKTELVHFDKVINSDDVLKELESKSMRPANLKELLQFAIDNPDEQRKYSIIALGSVWQDWGGDRRVPCLWFGSGERYLDLVWFENDWYEYNRFLAVRKSADTLTLGTSDKIISKKDYQKLLDIHEEALEILK